jgi:hypothetical protein
VTDQAATDIYVAVVSTSQRQVGFNDQVLERLGTRLADLQAALQTGVETAAEAVRGVRDRPGWSLDELKVQFSIALKAETGAILAKAGTEAVLGVEVKFVRETATGHAAPEAHS